ncbi:DUF916 and DUF3324 domain-containing protein [Jeotgalicoccus halotolerans]|uniref:DUF916 and DUF3324 domain-containing protein n=1 Tax=Jeotgalicoccus halotolerans TaxID=157227 RepID=UPI003512363B
MVTVLLLFLLFPLTVQANDGAVPYSVQSVLPDNQVDSNASYFDIEMAQGQEQELEVIVNNSSDEDITVEVSNNPGLTNSNGLIVYDGLDEDEELHESMAHPFSEMSSLESPTVDVAAGEQESVFLTVQAPDEAFDGVILGGLYFSLEPAESEATEGVTIQNRYSYALAVQITEEGNDNLVEPNIEILRVEPGIINHRTGLQTEFVNPRPMIVGLEIEGSVYGAGEEEPLYTRTEESFTVAPNTKFKYPIMYDNERLEPGDYIFRATASRGDESWEFEEEFEISEEKADEANEEAVELVEEEDNTLLMYLVIGLGVLVAVLLIVVIYLLRKRKK